MLAFDVPKKLHWMTEQYRAPARFVWIPMYTCIAFLLNWAFDAFRGKPWVLAFVAVAQIADGGVGDWVRLHKQTASTFRYFLPMAPWQRLVHAHNSVEVDDCILDGTYNVDQLSLEIEFYASQKALPINGVYSARPTRDCEAERQGRMNLDPVAGRLYVVLKKAKAVLPRFEAMGLKCAEFEYGWACSTKSTAIDTALADGIVTPMKPAPKLKKSIGRPAERRYRWKLAAHAARPSERTALWTTHLVGRRCAPERSTSRYAAFHV